MLSMMCQGPRSNSLNLVDNPDYDLDADLCLRPRSNPINFGGDLDYDPDPQYKITLQRGLCDVTLCCVAEVRRL